MNIKTLIKTLPLQTNPQKYEQFVKDLDYKKLLIEDPVEIRDKYYVDNEDLVETDLSYTSAYYELHQKLNEKYKLSEVATADTDFEKVIQTFVSAIRKFMRMETITAPLLHELIDHIDVYETEGTGKNKTQRIVIYYRFVGYIELPIQEEELFSNDTRQGVAVTYIPKALPESIKA